MRLKKTNSWAINVPKRALLGIYLFGVLDIEITICLENMAEHGSVLKKFSKFATLFGLILCKYPVPGTIPRFLIRLDGVPCALKHLFFRPCSSECRRALH